MAKKKAAKKKVTKKKAAKKKPTRKKKILPPAEFLTSSPESKTAKAKQSGSNNSYAEVPYYLVDAYPEDAERIWNLMFGVLSENRLLSPVDRFELALLVESSCQAAVYRRLIFPDKVMIESYKGVMISNPMLIRLEASVATIHKICAKFGLTPVDRSGRKDLEVAEKDDEIQTIND